jgi:1,4-alpha-glucan branching enzyme
LHGLDASARKEANCNDKEFWTVVLKRGKSEVTFVFKPDRESCKNVAVAGTFNDWQPNLKMARQKDGSYRKRVQLDSGEHRYRFVVDGDWVPDPQAEAQAPNPFGSVDSVVKVD